MPQFSARQRSLFLEQLRSGELDVLILGGGISGTGVLRDLVLRAGDAAGPGKLRFGLIEKNHFASSASSKNSQLVHGGLRYLKYLHLSLVRTALRERAVLARIAPHAVSPQSFLLPVYNWEKQWYYRAGVALYDLLSGKHRLRGSRWLSRAKALQEEPALNPEGLRGAVLFYDGRMESPRLVLDQLRESVELGGLAVNFLEAVETVREQGKVMGVVARDGLSGERFLIRARTLVNTLGPWEKSVQLRLVRGSHLVFPRLTGREHALAFFGEGGRIVFVIPYGPFQQFSLVGTTEKEQDEPEPVEMDEEEEDYLRRQIEKILPGSASHAKVGHYSALRPLIAGAGPATALSREHQIWQTAPNFYHVAGGKFTTFRLLAEELVDQMARRHFPALHPCATRHRPVDGNTPDLLQDLRRQAESLAHHHALERSVVDFLIGWHGRRATEVLAFCKDRELSRPLAPQLPFLRAQMLWAIENEMTERLEDFLTVSTPLAYLHAFEPAQREELERCFARMVAG